MDIHNTTESKVPELALNGNFQGPASCLPTQSNDSAVVLIEFGKGVKEPKYR